MATLTNSLLAFLWFAFANMAGAAGLYIGGTTSNIGFSGYDAPPSLVTGVYTKGTQGTLMTDTAGTVTATYLGDESGYDNFFSFVTTGPSSARNALNTLWEDSHTPSTPVGSSISKTVAANSVISFMYKDNQGPSVTHGVPIVLSDYATFAMLYTQSSPTAPKVYTNTNTWGMFDFIIGFNDSATVDADYDDFVVGVKFAPSPVPLPAAAWLFGSALFGFMMVSNRRKV
jgi:hypothetical protein